MSKTISEKNLRALIDALLAAGETGRRPEGRRAP